MIELDQLLRETDLCVQGLRKYFWQLVPWLVQEQKINTIGLDQLTSIDFWERPICEFKVCVYFWQLVPWPVQEQKINTMPERRICEFTVCIYFWQLFPWLVQEQKLNTIQFDWSSSIDLRESYLWVQGLGIFLRASSLAGARAKNKHDRVWERAICEFAFAYIFDS